jgi:hypothetical protein
MSSAPAKRGRGTTLRSKVVEGASDSMFHFRRKRFVEARAPSTALRAVPLPRYRGAGCRSAARERERLPSAPAKRGRGTTLRSKVWRGFLTRCFTFVGRDLLRPARLPPRCARSPFPATAGQDAEVRRENGSACLPLPRSGGGGPPCAARWWRGLLTRCFTFVERDLLRPAPLPPRFARSPFPATAGQDAEVRRENGPPCLPPPRSGGGGPPCAARWWRGFLTRCFIFVERDLLRPAPLPPRFARSPFPATAGQDAEVRREEGLSSLPSPRSGGGGPPCAARWWRGRRPHRISAAIRTMASAASSIRCVRSEAAICNTVTPCVFSQASRRISRCGRSPMSWVIPSISTASRAVAQ